MHRPHPREEYTVDGREFFLKDRKTQDAVIRNFQVIGEAVEELPELLREQYPDVPWQQAAKFRDRLTHDYFGVRLDVVWNVIVNELPALKGQMSKISQELKSSG